ncbi:DNA cytosine methyltransferase [Xanthobacter flavus]|uniref:DNA cytosine methyltransferase n=1 Tax=Xanthobacter flavus TaxID=281 RepID=UPI00372C8566
MFGVSQALLDELLPERSIPGSAAPWLSHSVDAERVHRHVRRRQGSVSTSSVPRGPSSGDLAADFDLAWMRSSISPAMAPAGPSISAADLFAGCGGMSLGLLETARALGMRCSFSFASEMDPVKAAVYTTNLDPARIHVGLVETLIDGAVGAPRTQSERALLRELDPIDVLLGGPPCQGHSDLNNHTRRDDARNGLIGRMVRFAELIQPSLVIIENVEGVRHDRRGSAAQAAEQLRAMGYDVVEPTITCTRLGVPQSRRRYVLVAARRDLAPAIAEFEALHLGERSVGWAIEDLLDVESEVTFDTAAVHAAANQRRMRFLFDNDLYDLPDAERPDCHRLKRHSYRGVYGRMKWDEPAPTITTGFGSTGQGRFVHPRRVRTLTPHEAARLQTYPDFFEFGPAGRTQLQKMIGNSVPPLAMATLGMALLR